MNQRTHHDLDHVVSLIQSFEALPEQQLTAATIHKYQKRLDDIATVYQHDEQVGSSRFVLYELQALLLNTQDRADQATECLEQGAALKPDGVAFISSAAQKWEGRITAQRKEDSKKLPPWRKIVIVVAGLVGLLVIVTTLLNSTFTTRVQTTQCGFFAQCQPGNAFERAIVTDAKPFNTSNIVVVIVVSLVFLAFLLLITRYRGQWRVGRSMVIYTVWTAILVGLVGLFVLSTQKGSVVESGGSITDEEYACQLQAIRSLENIGSETPASCPSSPESEKYWQNVTL